MPRWKLPLGNCGIEKPFQVTNKCVWSQTIIQLMQRSKDILDDLSKDYVKDKEINESQQIIDSLGGNRNRCKKRQNITQDRSFHI